MCQTKKGKGFKKARGYIFYVFRSIVDHGVRTRVRVLLGNRTSSLF
uniref:Uncharacterized protein n=1 Tax=Arabidopsis thaliana TaxID=3702 RepID=Q0WM02_ARATH|nr:hypothetical protein [Arabidopsis thaliana]